MNRSTDTVIFVCDQKDSIFADKALVGTTEHRVFLEYVDALNLSVNEVMLYDERDFRTVEAMARADRDVKVIVLGTDAEDRIQESDIPYSFLPLRTSELEGETLEVYLQDARDFIDDYNSN